VIAKNGAAFVTHCRDDTRGDNASSTRAGMLDSHRRAVRAGLRHDAVSLASAVTNSPLLPTRDCNLPCAHLRARAFTVGCDPNLRAQLRDAIAAARRLR
jgi:hypothetical protein